MALHLVVTSAFPGYARGTIITDSVTISAIRSSEYAAQVVLVSDTVILPPDPPNPSNPGGGASSADYIALRALYDTLAASDVTQQQALSAILSVNAGQNDAISILGQQLYALNSSVQVLAAQVANPNGGNPLPANLADDLPLAENDGVVLATDGNAVLAGDIR